MKILLAFLFPCLIAAAPLKVMVIGDSLSEEYRFEVPFSAPESDPLDANTKNWIEILGEQRVDEISFGEYKGEPFGWSDSRNGGYEYNWSVPGSETETWFEVFEAGPFDEPLLFFVAERLRDSVSKMDAAVIFLGGNDANSEYSNLYNDTPIDGWADTVVANLGVIVSKLRAEKPGLPIVLANVPDVGATLDVQSDHPDSMKRTVATSYIAALNTKINQLAAIRSLTVFDVFGLTEELNATEPFRIGNIEFFQNADPENRKRNLFCRDGFHPSTPAHIELANSIVAALDYATEAELTPLTDTESLVDVMGIDPAQDDAYLAWLSAFTVSNESLLADPDHDGIPNLGEYAFGLQPDVSDVIRFDYFTVPSRETYVKITPVSSTLLQNWQPVPANEITNLPNGRKQVTPSLPFMRYRFEVQN